MYIFLYFFVLYTKMNGFSFGIFSICFRFLFQLWVEFLAHNDLNLSVRKHQIKKENHFLWSFILYAFFFFIWLPIFFFTWIFEILIITQFSPLAEYGNHQFFCCKINFDLYVCVCGTGRIYIHSSKLIFKSFATIWRPDFDIMSLLGE